ncbi:hypothetical protein MUO32_25940 [Shinella sp. CPCC 101442]|uniref:hypothetical protein n=1 Tax=Shinella sp. CPCC 101442 TaxID=2932265 RepID=UPI002152F2B8|nr:hypothetical protein [Shinella sp. CPCC 101442]MCR6502473.1 hypothetical protein [Shinella sp. CPCC 101442]
MANFGSPAHTVAMGNAAGMMVIAGGAMCLARGVSDALDAVAEARYQRRYHDALYAASTHAREIENVARVAVELIAELEAEVAGLRTACAQRQAVINGLVGRA